MHWSLEYYSAFPVEALKIITLIILKMVGAFHITSSLYCCSLLTSITVCILFALVREIYERLKTAIIYRPS